MDIICGESVDPSEIKHISLTGQAESLVILDNNGHPLMNAISWMDERANEECTELLEIFDIKEF